ncbi:hypothetical protein R80B4_01508 [Fibrobacteres bacterium R8-0-B4]
MIPGPNIVYKCPECGRKAVRRSIISGNTFGSILYSDGKRIAPMLPEFPYIIKCGKCKTFYRLENKHKIGEYEGFDDESESMWENSDRAKFLSIDEYVEAINLKVYAIKDEELYLRRRLWWAFNDKYRRFDDEVFFNMNDKDRDRDIDNGKDKDIYESNCIQLIEILDKSEINDKITCAELYRNMGNFAECKNILETIQEEKYNWIKELLMNECEKNNKKVVLLRE